LLSTVPDSLVFHSLSDTATIRVRVRVPAAGLDTLVNPRAWSGGAVDPIALPVFVAGASGLVLESRRNGSEWAFTYFGRVPIMFRVIVQQLPVALRIVPEESTVPVADTLVAGPDSVLALAVQGVDARGRVIEDVPFGAAAGWTTTDPGVAIVDSPGHVRTIADGVTAIGATVGELQVEAVLRVWTLRAQSVVTGGASSCALLNDGGVACWGFRTVGANSAIDFAVAPERRPFGPFDSLRMSESGACALDAAGAAFCWGVNNAGQLGTGAPGSYQPSPLPVGGGLRFASIGTGAGRNCGLTSAGVAYCWGSGIDGLLGDGTYGTMACGAGGSFCTPNPTPVAGGHTFTALAVGDSHACGLTGDGRAICWGSNRYGQLGSTRVQCAGYPGADPATSGYWCSTVPVPVSGDLRFASLSAGSAHTCGITLDGALHCWGSNLNGVLGVEGFPEGGAFSEVPLEVTPGRRYTVVSAQAQTHTCAIDDAGEAWCWGLNGSGWLGTGAPGTGSCLNGACDLVPARVAGGLLFRSIAPAFSHTCGMTTSDELWCWGWGEKGALGNGGTADATVPRRVAFQKP
jgi:alpha-tubulin suppressor-like RCC1 family protein